MSDFIKNLRLKHRLSQEYLAKELSISRQTFAQMEEYPDQFSVAQTKRLAEIFEIDINELIDEKIENTELHIIIENKPTKSITPDMRISIPQKNLNTLKEVLLYILEKAGAKPHVGETVIYKWLYFIDFDFYEKYEKQFIGATYIRNIRGPTPLEFKKVIDEMIKKQEVEAIKSKFFQYPQKKYLVTGKRRSKYFHNNLSIEEVAEKQLINSVLNRFGNKTAKEMSDWSHGDVPWKTHKQGEIIDYETVFYRNDPYSVKEFEDEI